MPKILFGDGARLFHQRTIFLQQKTRYQNSFCKIRDTLCGLKTNAEFSLQSASHKSRVDNQRQIGRKYANYERLF